MQNCCVCALEKKVDQLILFVIKPSNGKLMQAKWICKRCSDAINNNGQPGEEFFKDQE